MATLTLTIDSLTVALGRFAGSAGYQRLLAQFGEAERSAYGASILDGPGYEEMHLWTINAVCTLEEKYLVEAIQFRCEKKRRSFLDPAVLVVDRIQHLVEDSPRTRAIASGAAEIAVPGGAVAYFGQFSCYLNNLKIDRYGAIDYLCSFTLTELAKVAA